MIIDLALNFYCERTRRTVDATGPSISLAVSRACNELSRRYTATHQMTSATGRAVVGVESIDPEIDDDGPAPIAVIKQRPNDWREDNPYALQMGRDLFRQAARWDDDLLIIDVIDAYERAKARVTRINFPDLVEEEFRREDPDPETSLNEYIKAAHRLMLWDVQAEPVDIAQELDQLWGSGDWTHVLPRERLTVPLVTILTVKVLGACSNGWMLSFFYWDGDKIGQEVEFASRDRAGRFLVCRDERSALRSYDASFVGGQIDQVHMALQVELDADRFSEKPRVILSGFPTSSHDTATGN